MTNDPDTSTLAKRALLIRNAAPYDFGGAERFVINLGSELQKQGWEATVVSAHQQIKEQSQKAGVPFATGPWRLSWQDLSGWRIVLFPLYTLWIGKVIREYTRLCKQIKPTVIHPQSRDDFIAATIVGRKLGIPVIWTDHADLKYIYQNVPVPLKNPVGKWVHRIASGAKAITLVSKSERQLIADALRISPDELPGQYQVIYNGVTDKPVTPITRAEADRDAVIFCATSRMVTAKGIGELITAFTDIDARTNARLWLVGDGPEIETFKAQAASNPHIVFMGFQSDAHSILAAADIFVHPSYHEGFSISIVEAAWLGKPIIACDVGGNAEIVQSGKNGILIASKDSAALATAMATLAKDATLRQQYGVAARAMYKSQFEFDMIVKERFIPLYEQR